MRATAQQAQKLPGQPAVQKTRKALRVYVDTPFYKFHSNLMLLLLVYILLVFTLDIGFGFSNRSSALSNTKLLILLYLVFDVVLRFFTVFTKEGVLVDCLKQIASSYSCSYLFLDFLGSMPFEVFLDIEETFLMQLIVLCRIVRMVNVLVSNRHFAQVYSSHLKRAITSSKLLSLYEVLTATLLVLHISSCVLVGLSNISDVDTWYEK
jgi:hypothetical protein